MTAIFDTAPPAHVINESRLNASQTHYQLSTPVAQTVIGKDFVTEHVVVSHGSHGDTAIFPAGPEGNILDLMALWMDDGYVEHGEAVCAWLGGQA